MPDLDRIEQAVLHPWRRAARLLRGGASVPEIGKASVQGLARACRLGRGIPAVEECLEIVVGARSGRLALGDALDRIDTLESALGHSRHAKVAAQAVRDCLMEGPMDISAVRGADPSLELADRFLERLEDHGFYGRLAPELVGSSLATVEGAEARLEEVRRWAVPHRRGLAERLAGRPDGAVQAPPISLGVRPGLAELLAEPL